jgi:acetyl esterase/lipase
MIPSILTDAFRSPSSSKITITKHYYTSHQTYEQSLDIYLPNNVNSNKPIVALVVGSAWVGHKSFIYAQTSWWNSAGPLTVARLGYPCVCIRHRGSFPRIFSPLTVLFVVVAIGLSAFLLEGMSRLLNVSAMDLLEEWSVGGATALFVAFATGMLIMDFARRGSASFTDMQKDVMDAMSWFDENRTKLFNEQQSKQRIRNKIVFGGYSSGGHVAAMVMQQPHLWKERNLPLPEAYCSTALYISPVLCTTPYHVNLERHLSSLSLKKMSTSLSSSTTHSIEESTTKPQAPSWLTDHLITTVFGYTIPSPIQTYQNSPTIPHVFIGCHKEMFGLDWLDLFFASRDYNELLLARGVDSRFVGVDSDHWNILRSWELMEVLERELGRIND